MKKVIIEKYDVETKKVIMNIDTARALYYAINGFEAGLFGAEDYIDEEDVADYVIRNFLADESARELNTLGYESRIVFIKAVKEKIKELV